MKRQRKRTGSKKKAMRGGFSKLVNPAETSATFAQGAGAEGAAPYVEAKYGDVNQQYNSVFDINSKTQGNTFTQLPESQQPTSSSLQLIQSAGKRRRKKMGGMGVIETAVVPFGLLAAHNRYGKKSKKSNKSKKTKLFKGGKTRKAKKKGGMIGQIVSTAAVPFALLGAHNFFGKKSKKSKKSKQSRK